MSVLDTSAPAVHEQSVSTPELTVSVIICAYTDERWEALVRAITSVQLQHRHADEIIVVIDTNPGLAERVRGRFDQIRVLENTGARGHSAASNLGIAAATGDVIAFLDDDAEAEPDWLGVLLSGYLDDTVLGVGGHLEPCWLSERPRWFPDEFLWAVGCSYRGLPEERAPVRNLIGANMSIRRQVFEEVGGFRTSLSRVGNRPFAGHEPELCIRAAQRYPDGVFLHEPRARVHHRVPAERTTLKYLLIHARDEAMAKIFMSRFVGPQQALEAERTYMTRTLPSGVLEGLRDTVRRGDVNGLRRAAAIILGVLAAGAGFARAQFSQKASTEDVTLLGAPEASPPASTPAGPSGSLEPLQILDVELSQPLPVIEPRLSEAGTPYRRALSLVRLHSQPLGQVEIVLGNEGLQPEEYARQIWTGLSDEIGRHMRLDGLAEPSGLDAGGLGPLPSPECLAERRRVLRDAPFLSVVIPTHERPTQLRRCIDSLLACEYPPDRYEVVVVDNVPTSSVTADLVRRQSPAHTSVRYVRSDVPGSASARNAGILAARAEIVAFVDDDVVVDPWWLAEVGTGFRAGDDVACVTGLILPAELETPAQLLLREYGGFDKGFEPKLYRGGTTRIEDPLFPWNAGSFGSGANMAFRRSAFPAGFDPALGNCTPALGGVDLEAFFRILVDGHDLAYRPGAIVRHPDHRDYDRVARAVYTYAVGLSAFVVCSVLRRPRLLGDLLRKLPGGIAFAVSPRSQKHAKKSAAYPLDLRWQELRGMLYGPLAYTRSRQQFGTARPLGATAAHERGSSDAHAA